MTRLLIVIFEFKSECFLNVRLKHDSVQCQNEKSKFQQNISNIVVFDNALHDRLFESFDTLDVCK